MMWTRSELKQRAKVSFKRCYWSAVAVCFIMLVLQFLTGNGGTAPTMTYRINGNTVYEQDAAVSQTQDYVERYVLSESGMGMLSAFLSTGLAFYAVIIILLQIALNYFIFNPLYVGMASFFYRSRKEKMSVGELAFPFNKDYFVPVVKTMFFVKLYTFLWTLLFIIPGIVKSYSYRMVPYILSETPNLSTKDAIQLSKDMTQGHKLNIFILDLSFFGWALLGAITFGLTDIFYTLPYREATEAELYAVLREPFIKASAEADVF